MFSKTYNLNFLLCLCILLCIKPQMNKTYKLFTNSRHCPPLHFVTNFSEKTLVMAIFLLCLYHRRQILIVMVIYFNFTCFKHFYLLLQINRDMLVSCFIFNATLKPLNCLPNSLFFFNESIIWCQKI